MLFQAEIGAYLVKPKFWMAYHWIYVIILLLPHKGSYYIGLSFDALLWMVFIVTPKKIEKWENGNVVAGRNPAAPWMIEPPKMAVMFLVYNKS